MPEAVEILSMFQCNHKKSLVSILQDIGKGPIDIPLAETAGYPGKGKEPSIKPRGREMTGAFISVIIPNHNGSATLGACLEAATRSAYGDYEVIVVDDCSSDGSQELASGFPCRLIRLEAHGGASKARNTGAREARGEALLFIDADCVLTEGAMEMAASLYERHKGAVIGGTYTPMPYDRGFFSTFQSVFIHYFETKRTEPDYIAAHAMLIDREVFLQNGGFPEKFLPIIEDVEFSHRLRRNGVRLVMEPGLMVKHIFHYTLMGSLKNAYRKSSFWTTYSLGNRDLMRDSGTASVELKINTLCWPLFMLPLALLPLSGNACFLLASAVALALNMGVNMRFIRFMLGASGASFAAKAVLYYVLVYPLAVGAGGLEGLIRSGRNAFAA
jgi:GT2 family glycosyltransferase